MLDLAKGAAQAIEIAVKHTVITADGKPLPVEAQTICLHSDSPNAPAMAKEINQRLKAAGVTVRQQQPS